MERIHKNENRNIIFMIAKLMFYVMRDYRQNAKIFFATIINYFMLTLSAIDYFCGMMCMRFSSGNMS